MADPDWTKRLFATGGVRAAVDQLTALRRSSSRDAAQSASE